MTEIPKETLAERIMRLRKEYSKTNEEVLKLTPEERVKLEKVEKTKPQEEIEDESELPLDVDSELDVPDQDEENPLRGMIGKGAMDSLLEPVQEEPSLKDKLFTSDEILMKTRLTPEMTVQVANAKMISLLDDLPEVELYLDYLMQGRVSILGEGRKEAVEMVKGESLYGFASDVAQRTKG